jgi:hypothetical protein
MMKYSTLDIIAIAIVAVVSGVQFLRVKDDFSRVFYEAICLVGAAYGANRLYPLIVDLTRFSTAVSFLFCFVLLAACGLAFAALVNARAAFDLGALNYLLGLLVAVICAYSVGHAAMRTFELGFVTGNEEMMMAMGRSWVARELIYLRTAKEVLVVLRFARYRNM